MPCDRVTLPDGGVAIICSRSGPRKRCSVPGCDAWATKLCDYPTPGPKTPNRTCSKRVCAKHATHVGEDRDLCPPHAKLVEASKVPASVLADPEPYALKVAADIVEAQRETAPSVPRGTQLEERPRPFVARDHADWLEYYTERAAIGEHERGMDRTTSEYEARQWAGEPPRQGQQEMRLR